MANKMVEIDESEGSSAEATASRKPTNRDFEVFLNFRGRDSRHTVVDAIRQRLYREGFRVFYDDKSIEKGEVIAGELMEAITNSKIYIPIFSKDYASSRWCLRELEKIVECWKASKEREEKTILPIFYDISVEDVKLRSELYTTALNKHKAERGEDVVKPWENALQTAATIKGWNLNHLQLGLCELTELIVEKVDCKLRARSDPEGALDEYVGIRSQMDKIKKRLDLNAPDVRFVFIHGVVGVGKTTLAEHVYDDISSHFPQGVAFLLDVGEKSREAGVVELQKDLLSQLSRGKLRDIRIAHPDEGARTIKKKLNKKKVLIVLDNLDKKDQLQKLAGEISWFGGGSRIIVTTRNSDIVREGKGFYEHKLSGLKDDDAQMMFRREALDSDSPTYDEKISRDVVNMACGNPAAIRAMAPFFKCYNKGEWSSILKKSQKVVNAKLKEILLISYYQLFDHAQREIFLDIACFFINKELEDVLHYWEAQELSPHHGIMVLRNFSLIEIVDGEKLWMNSLLQDLGRHTVDEEDIEFPERRSRLYLPAVALEVVRRGKGTEKVRALDLGKVDGQHSFDHEQFKGFTNLKFIQLEGGKFTEESCKKEIFSNLRWLSWSDCQREFQAQYISFGKLVVAMLSKTNIRDDWGGWDALKKARDLKVLKCTDCHDLTSLPNLGRFSILERLGFENCSSFSIFNGEIGTLNYLAYLDITNTSNIRELPMSMFWMESISVLKLGSKDLDKLPDEIGMPKNLKRLYLRYPQMRKLPESVGKLKSLAMLDISHTSITKLPHSVEENKSLTVKRPLPPAGQKEDKKRPMPPK